MSIINITLLSEEKVYRISLHLLLYQYAIIIVEIQVMAHSHSHNNSQLGQWFGAKTAVFWKVSENSEKLLEQHFYGLHYSADVIHADVEIAEKLFGDVDEARSGLKCNWLAKVRTDIEEKIMKIIMRINEQ